jgi:hypothetical protein
MNYLYCSNGLTTQTIICFLCNKFRPIKNRIHVVNCLVSLIRKITTSKTHFQPINRSLGVWYNYARISPRRPGFAPRAVHMGFVVDKAALRQVFLRVLRFSPVNTIPPLIDIHSCMIWRLDNGPVSGPVPQRHSFTQLQQ